MIGIPNCRVAGFRSAIAEQSIQDNIPSTNKAFPEAPSRFSSQLSKPVIVPWAYP